MMLIQNQLDNLKRRVDQLDKDMEAIAEGIKRNNAMTQSILDAINEEKSKKEIPIINGGRTAI